jgi:hypothetical protein
MNVLKKALDTQAVEKILGFAVGITGFLQVLQVSDGRNLEALVSLKSAHDRKRNQEVVAPLMHGSIAAHLIDDPVKHYHFTVEMLKRSQAEVPVSQEIPS